MDPHLFPAILAMNSAAIALAVAIVAHDYPPRIAGAMYTFAGGKLIMAAAYGLVAMRGVLPDLVTVMVADTVGVFGIYVNYATARTLMGRRQNVPLAIGCFIIFIAATFVFSYLPADLRGARITTSIAGLLVSAALSYELLFRYQRNGRAHIVCGGLGAVITVLLGIRAIHSFLIGPVPMNAPTNDVVEDAFYIGVLFANTLGTVALVLLSNDEFNAELSRLVGVDSLSGVASRRRLLERGDEEFRRAGRFRRAFSVLLIDVDHFKRINDRFGHAVGDRAIRAMADCCIGVVRDVDVVGRLGGEEFVVLMPDTDETGAADVAERVRKAASALSFAADGGAPLPVTVSVGVATMSNDASFADLLARADRAMYQAKKDGRDCVRIAGPEIEAASQ